MNDDQTRTPMPDRTTLRFGARSDVGHVREVNEDAHLTEPPVFVVADGMGGHHGGDRASRIVIEEFARLAGPGYDTDSARQAVLGALGESQRRVHAVGSVSGAIRRAGTTVTVAVLAEEDPQPHWVLANLGDSRAYRFHAGALEQVSVDHSVVQELIDAGRINAEEAASHPARHVITRAVGGQVQADADYFRIPLSQAPRLLLCSDGINGMLADAELARILGDATDPQQAADDLVAAALAAGGIDNATAVVVDAPGPESR